MGFIRGDGEFAAVCMCVRPDKGINKCNAEVLLLGRFNFEPIVLGCTVRRALCHNVNAF